MTKVNCSLDVLMITVSEENVNARDSHGWAPIHYAADFGEIKFIKGSGCSVSFNQKETRPFNLDGANLKTHFVPQNVKN